MDTQSPRSLTIPGAIIVAAAILAIAIIWTRKPIVIERPADDRNATPVQMVTVSPDDHILGNPEATVVIVEYSDASCPFCKEFHSTMRKIMSEYGPSGQVAWVYRHFPIDKPGTRPDGGILHSNAGREAQAMECAFEQGGNEKFWTFANRLFEVTPSVTPQTPAGLDPARLPEIARDSGLDAGSFEACLASGRYGERVEKQYLEGIDVGVLGTPHSFLVVEGTRGSATIEGAMSYDDIKAMIEASLSR